MEKKIIQLAGEVFSREPRCRPETEWIQQRVNRLAEAKGIRSKADTDAFIFEKMYSRVPEKKDTVKIRYWRTGHHLPTSREEALRFADALEMDHREKKYLLQVCMEKSDLVFDRVPDPEETMSALYRDRTSLMENMISEYVAQVSPTRMIQLNIPYEKLSAYVRHLYCMDAVSIVSVCDTEERNDLLKNHFSSVNYESEFLRIRKLLGEIPRRTMLRHIFLLGIPYLNRRLTDDRLRALGYLPLTEGHTGPRGALVDDLIIGFLRLYEDSCRGRDPLMCRQWISEQLYHLDRYLREQGKEEYRFLYFRSLAAMID